MKKLIFLALVVFAGWYGWNHKDTLFQRKDSHDAIIENDTGEGMERIRLTADGQTTVKELLHAGETATLPFRVTNDSGFELKWEWVQRSGEMTWRGGRVAAGPMLQVHRFIVRGENNVVYQVEQKNRPAEP
jgi:hypothetical protein